MRSSLVLYFFQAGRPVLVAKRVLATISLGMKWVLLFATSALMLSACEKSVSASSSEAPKPTLAEARKGFQTHLIRKERVGEEPASPPTGLFRVVYYASSVGPLAAYVSPSPGDNNKHPLVIWLTGGFSNSISEIALTPGPKENDQSASTFREAGILMMYPSLRGGNENAGSLEGFYGEVDDVIAAAKYASKLDYVDPNRIYLGGHSTGGTLALLVAESTDMFRAVFAFGPVDDVRGYGQDNLPFDLSNRKEVDLRAPIKWLTSIRTPTFVFEGTTGRSNIAALKALALAKHPPVVFFFPIRGGDHFSILAPVSRLIATKIKADNAAHSTIRFSEQEIATTLRR